MELSYTEMVGFICVFEQSLYKVRSGCNSASQAPQHTATLKSSDHTVEEINAALREQIIDLIEKDKCTPFCYDQLNIDDLNK